ncbi:hypothetical protein PUR61_34405 [Streptomyces sp. BE20]|uniref:hypothetical protein n=1 Tax=Streptomycetaceae TaxID=2062 RepID=UPI002E76C13D|nr:MULTISPECIES: hypothetical protein [unclassified Streptomyces]MED7950518.1 hypothetical protein [Streptomyces sp. BE303]MEE1827245.1 hypothetical protein [Streptomyces sp. BE20]
MAALVPAPATREPGARGRLRIADRVYARIAARAAGEALAEVRPGRSGPGGPPKVSVTGPASPSAAVTVRVAVDLPFPADLAALARAVRDRVAAQVGALTGTRVAEVVVVVERLVTEGTG